MSEQISRALRDGSIEGEHAPALTIKDSINTPLGHLVFDNILTQLYSNIISSKAQSRGIVLVALSRSPSYYAQLLESREIDVTSSNKWLRVLDCYTDPLGWKSRLAEHESINNEASLESSIKASLFNNVKDLDKLLAKVIELGREMVGEGKELFAVAIDLVTFMFMKVRRNSFFHLKIDSKEMEVSEMFRHATLASVAGLLSNLRGHDQVSCVFWLLHSDLHEVKATAALEYMSSMQANIEPIAQVSEEQKFNSENISLVEQNFSRGKFHARFKRRNGRVRLMSEELNVEQSGVKFVPVSSQDGIVAQSLLPKVQFNLQLSEKEQNDRAKVVLPFEHQGNGKTIQIYDGRTANNTEEKHEAAGKLPRGEDSGRGEIIYFRDSDDEMPDSDEDPDDDLDI